MAKYVIEIDTETKEFKMMVDGVEANYDEVSVGCYNRYDCYTSYNRQEENRQCYVSLSKTEDNGVRHCQHTSFDTKGNMVEGSVKSSEFMKSVAKAEASVRGQITLSKYMKKDKKTKEKSEK